MPLGMIKAYHTTTKDVYEKIKADGYIRPRRRLREFGEHGYGFESRLGCRR